ncbi:MAG: hypothetical protein WBC82_12120 [Dehalococcoidia bacterium]
MEEDQWQPPTNNGRARKIIPVVLVIFLIIAVGMVITLSVKGGFEPTPTPTPTPTGTPTPLPTVTMSCEQAKHAIQEALNAYNTEHGEWPTADGQPGDIEWTKLVPDFMAAVPYRCDWRVNSDPVGEVCLQRTC